MPFGDQETSLDSARPIELFEVSYSGNFWYYTSADRDVIFQGRTYVATVCSRGEINQSVSDSASGLTLSFPHDIPFVDVFRVQPPSEVVSLTALVQNYLIPAEFVVLWKGRILNVNWKSPWAELVTESVVASMNRAGLRRRQTPNCQYPLYSARCGVLRDNYREDTTLFSVDAYTVIAQASIGKVDNYYAGGMVTWAHRTNGNQEKRMIVSSVGSTGELTLASLTVGLQGAQAVTLFPGCDHTISTCDSKFNNKDNCGAMAYIPKKNPFGGTTLY